MVASGDSSNDPSTQNHTVDPEAWEQHYIDQITPSADSEEVKVTNVPRTIRVSSREEGEKLDPGEFIVELVSGSCMVRERYKKTWSAEKGFGYVLQSDKSSLQAAPAIRWDPFRISQENEKIQPEGEGADRSEVLTLLSNVQNTRNPINYLVELNVGSRPEDKFWVNVDSGSHLLWLQSRFKSSEKIPPGKHVYDLAPGKNHTAKYVSDTKSLQYQYGDGLSIECSFFRESFSIGSLQVADQMFGAVPFSKLVTPKEQLSQKPLDGVLGLGFALMDSQVPYHKNLVLQLASERKLKHASFSLIGPRVQPQDTSEFYDSDRKYRGSFVIGTVPREFYKGDITWCDSEVTKYRRWVVKMKSVKINGEIICTDQLAMIDTGLSYILTGPKNLARAASEMGGAVSGRGISYPHGSLRSVEFTFGEPARTFKLTPSDLFLDVESKESSNLISSIKTTPSWSFGQDWWILGGIFLDNMVTIFDYSGDKRIGFADLSDD